jgi:hypothetical protein
MTLGFIKIQKYFTHLNNLDESVWLVSPMV